MHEMHEQYSFTTTRQQIDFREHRFNCEAYQVTFAGKHWKVDSPCQDPCHLRIVLAPQAPPAQVEHLSETALELAHIKGHLLPETTFFRHTLAFAKYY